MKYDQLKLEIQMIHRKLPCPPRRYSAAGEGPLENASRFRTFLSIAGYSRRSDQATAEDGSRSARSYLGQLWAASVRYAQASPAMLRSMSCPSPSKTQSRPAAWQPGYS